MNYQDAKDRCEAVQLRGTASKPISSFSIPICCEIESVRVEIDGASTHHEVRVVLTYYFQGVDLSAQPRLLQDLMLSTISQKDGSGRLLPILLNILFRNPFEFRGELTYIVPLHNLMQLIAALQHCIVFQFGSSEEYSPVQLTMPIVQWRQVGVPSCEECTRPMNISDCSGEYALGFQCNNCAIRFEPQFRWFCNLCKSDYCFPCSPLPNFSSLCSQGHKMNRCDGNENGRRSCDKCKRKSLELDFEYYHCPEDGFDLCLQCAFMLYEI